MWSLLWSLQFQEKEEHQQSKERLRDVLVRVLLRPQDVTRRDRHEESEHDTGRSPGDEPSEKAREENRSGREGHRNPERPALHLYRRSVRPVKQPGRRRQGHIEEGRPYGDATLREVHQRVEDDRARIVGRRESSAPQVIVVVRGQGPGAASRGQLFSSREAQADADRDRRGETEEEHEPPRSH